MRQALVRDYICLVHGTLHWILSIVKEFALVSLQIVYLGNEFLPCPSLFQVIVIYDYDGGNLFMKMGN